MTLIPDVGCASADTYASLSEAASYLAQREPFDYAADWSALSSAQQEFRLDIAAYVLDSFPFRGVRCTDSQARAFPRFYPKDSRYPNRVRQRGESRADYMERTDAYREAEPPYDTWDDLLTDVSAVSDYTVPTIPTEVKRAQIEIAFQVVNKQMLTLDAMEPGDTAVQSIGIGGKINIGLATGTKSISHEFMSKAAYGATSIVRFYLDRHISSMRVFLL